MEDSLRVFLVRRHACYVVKALMPCDIDFAFAIMFSNFCDGFPCARTQTASVYHGVKELGYGVGYRHHLPVPVEHEGDF